MGAVPNSTGDIPVQKVRQSGVVRWLPLIFFEKYLEYIQSVCKFARPKQNKEMKAAELPNRFIALGRDALSKQKVVIPFTDKNVVTLEQFIDENQDEYTAANYPDAYAASRQFEFDVVTLFNPELSGQLLDIRTKFYKVTCFSYSRTISRNFK